MCGIYGYVGNENAYNKVFEGLKILQYRGYDSCGIAYYTNKFEVVKAVGVLDNLKNPNTNCKIAFGHTRWATNGEVNIENAHPHVSYDGKYTVVHNGIISNADSIKQDLLKQNITFYSDTDTEVIVNLLAAMKGKEEDNIKSLMNILKGSFSLIIGNTSGELYLLKQFSPLNLAKTNEGIYFSSDISSLSDGELYSLEDGDIIKISNNEIISLNDKSLKYTILKNDKNKLELNNFPHYMLKEIYETPEAIYNTYNYLKKTSIEKHLKRYKHLTLIGCGTAYHSCLVGEYLLKKLNKFNIETSLASTIVINKKIKKNHLHIILSQSGETADCIKVAKQIKLYGGKVLVITNQEKSSILKFADFYLITQAKRELAVASTKTYSTQIFVFAYIYNKIKNKDYTLDITHFCATLKSYIKNLDVDAYVQALANKDKTILIARDIDYITMLEASLKIREINYIYTIPIISSELKHGTLSLIEQDSIVLSLNTSNNKTLLATSINEINSRGGKVISFDNLYPNSNLEDCYKPIFAIIPFQMLTYKLAINRGLNPDMPRNLAKSVTVE